MHFGHRLACAAVDSCAVDLLLFVLSCTSYYLWGYCDWSLFCYVLLCVLSSFEIILKREREKERERERNDCFALLQLSS